MSKVLRQPTKAQIPTQRITKISQLTLKWSGVVLVASVWGSAALFGLYILAFYAAALYEGNLERWNNVLPGLYEKGSLAATSGIGLHFAAGGIILVLGSLQLIGKIRIRYPALHRWVGRLYIVSSILAAVGGLVFILLKGTIGGLVMDIGFAGYGLLMLLAAVQTFRHAVARRLEQHRAWALRLFALAIGSWLYRMDYGFWYLLTDAMGHNKQFNGPFDQVMAFFFYLPNLAVAQAFIRDREFRASVALRFSAAFLLLFATVFLVIGTYYFTLFYWGPAIMRLVTGD
ncbi:DUF2306 domain-containing protein [Rufibacter latericius]|uniref:DUF2306 domain-containing protein n=1 Tax=Rufibacter latericius TaxID=2487040 RepID=A0A3M9MA12_9BACT|nr:DUF2306 domain-containing protein [Rufibacter latericius]RNI22017.1 DUF2306 domain-containing protein [Rufibacter latericius]